MCDWPEFYRSNEHSARKPYRCYECGGCIAPGETYIYVAGKWDGEMDSFRFCPDCYDLYGELNQSRSEYFPFGEVLSFLLEAGAEFGEQLHRYWKNAERRGVDFSSYHASTTETMQQILKEWMLSESTPVETTFSPA